MQLIVLYLRFFHLWHEIHDVERLSYMFSPFISQSSIKKSFSFCHVLFTQFIYGLTHFYIRQATSIKSKSFADRLTLRSKRSFPVCAHATVCDLRLLSNLLSDKAAFYFRHGCKQGLQQQQSSRPINKPLQSSLVCCCFRPYVLQISVASKLHVDLARLLLLAFVSRRSTPHSRYEYRGMETICKVIHSHFLQLFQKRGAISKYC